MLVVNDTSLRWYSEMQVADWLRAPTDGWSQPGVAIADCDVAEPGSAWTQQVDFIVFTPHAVIVLEVKGIHPEITDGHLIAEPNDRWHHDLTDLEPVRTRARDTNPLDQARKAALTLKSFTCKHNPDHAFVHAAVVLVPPHNSTLTLRAGPTPRGTALALGETGLHAALDTTLGTRPIWTAEQVYSMFNALGLGRLITIGELIEQGFPTLDQAHTTPVPPRPSPSSPASAPRPPAFTRLRPATTPASHRLPSTPTRTRHVTATSAGPHREHRGRHRGQQAAAVAVIVSFAVMIWWLVAHFQPTPSRTPVPQQPTPPTLHEPPAGPDTVQPSHPAL